MIREHYIDQVALEAMKIILAEGPQEEIPIPEWHAQVAEDSYSLARAMWKAKNTTTTEEA